MSSDIPNPLETLQLIEQKYSSITYNPATLKRIAEECHSFCMVLDGYRFSEGSCSLDTLHRIEEDWGSFLEFSDEYLSMLSHLRETLKWTEDECSSFNIFLSEKPDTFDLCYALWQADRECGSLVIFSEKYLSSDESLPIETLQRIKDECDSLEVDLSAFKYLERIFKFLKRDIKLLDIILNLQIFTGEQDLIKKVQALFQGAAADLFLIYSLQVIPESNQFQHCVSGLENNFWQTKLEIRAKYSFTGISFQLLANNDENPRDQIEKALKELKFLKSFVCFVSDRCIESQVQHTFFTHVLEVAWHTTVVTWLYLPSKKYIDSDADEGYPLFSDLLRSKIQPIEPSISKIYIDVLQAIKLVQSQWCPVVQIKYVVDCEVGFVETLLHNLEELPFILNGIEIKEMLNFLRALLVQVPEFSLQDIDSVIIDAGLLVYSLNNKEKGDLDFRVKIWSMQAMIYLITRKTFLFQSSLPGIDVVGSTDFILDNREKCLSLYLSFDFVENQLRALQKELKCFQVVVEQQEHLVTQINGWVYEVEHISDACRKKNVPDWCLLLWILDIGEDLRVLMAEIAELQDKNEFDLVLHNTTDVPNAHISSKFASNASTNEEMVGFKDVMVELRGKLIKGSVNLDVVSIVGMPGLGKTTLANELYVDEFVVSYFDICVHCCVSQEYKRKDLLLALLRDVTDDKAKLDKEAENELADKLQKLLKPKRYLVLIDDVWKRSAWDDLQSCFPENKKGSRIILTTRHYEVASYAKHVSDPHKLRFFDIDESWTLLQNKVFNKERCPLVLEAVGKSIAQKCGGLPLSMVLVAGILTRMKKEKHCWEQVSTNLGPNIQAQSEGTLDLSYRNLPHYLKPCFLYMGVFPEDREIQVSKLTWLWIAEGFINTHMEKLSEDIAKFYLENLIGRNLVMVAKKSSDGRIKTCRIHDLVLEFCRKKAKLENFLERIRDSGSSPSQFSPPMCNTSRRLYLYSQSENLPKWCLFFSHVKSFQFREARNIAFSSIDCFLDTFKRFKFLRVLDFEFTMIDSIPQELTLLKYLAFRTAQDTLSLPDNLQNLETLIVQGLRGRVSLSNTIWKMVKLRHIHIYERAFFTLNSGQEFSECDSTMVNLQTVSSTCFSCVDNADKILEKMPNLQKLRCEVSKFDGSFPAFCNLTKLETLKISSGTKLTLIDQLKFPSSLKKLTLSNFHIHLTEVANHPKLEVLKLLGVTISSNVWKVNDEQFLQLKFLKLENPSFSEWDASDNAFPCLEHLVLRRCRHLKAIASCFGNVSSLKSVEIISCNEELVKSAEAVREELEGMSGTSGFELFIPKQQKKQI
ncbi:PREDICTED: putative late blight resistance protein homolog R1A-3 isoform X2 [Nicotiana attenuata]|uniref:putative late blight resistance protein homolog R1A-3 isoform X2 n=1 Tax=Nicotiana attenuata TaxID=49451 RepID=UPI000905463A|nr:PREDICTED: putative late blight resistance protein homolog R1A-3 isoform X2 [Nicotiana attenuata]